MDEIKVASPLLGESVAERNDRQDGPRPGIPRAIELVISVIGIILSAPLVALAGVAIALSSRGAIIFKQTRVGRDGRPFTLYKLRTMRTTQDSVQVTASNDGRILWVGRILRKTKLDELPELWNVLKGDMSLVGPRPEVQKYVDLSNRLWQKVLEARPGLTDPVTLHLRNEEALMERVSEDRERFYVETLQPYKLQGYLAYLYGRSVWTDLKVLWKSFVAIFLPHTALPPTVKEISSYAGNPDQVKSLNDEWSSLIKAKPKLWRKHVLTKQLQVGLDLVVLVASFMLAYVLRYDFTIPRTELPHLFIQLSYVVLIQIMLMKLGGVYRFIWRYIGMAEVKTFIKAAVFSAAPVFIIRLSLSEQFQSLRVPLSVIFIDTILAFGGVLGMRVSRRAMYEKYEKRRRAAPTNGNRKSVLLVGAGRAGVIAAREIQNRGDLNLSIEGFVDDSPEKQNSIINGVRVLGTTQDLPMLVRVLEIDHVVISIAQASRAEFGRILNICKGIPVKVRTIPGLYEILQGNVKVSRIRDIQIEDLLGREPVQLDEESMLRFLAGKVVMVTGAGGSIGSALAQQAARFTPAKLLLVERAEFALFTVDRELQANWPSLAIVPLVADLGDEIRMRGIFSAHRPEVVLHAAAHKHVPMMESNVAEAVRNNVLATHLLGELAGEYGAEAFVLISTDKAVRPTSVMGASKRMAELVIQDLGCRYATRYLVVRFGNVIGSTGSVIPIFSDQILKGGPVTVTHPDMVRYFMTIPEAAQLVLQAGALGQGGEIFILDMGEPVRILDLAKEAITLSGLRPFVDIDIVFTGKRPGEKMFEELLMDEEHLTETRHPKIFVGRIEPYREKEVAYALDQLSILTRDNRERELRLFLNRFLKEARLEIRAVERESEQEFRQFAASAVGPHA